LLIINQYKLVIQDDAEIKLSISQGSQFTNPVQIDFHSHNETSDVKGCCIICSILVFCIHNKKSVLTNIANASNHVLFIILITIVIRFGNKKTRVAQSKTLNMNLKTCSHSLSSNIFLNIDNHHVISHNSQDNIRI
jgi:hypothetical protein